MTIPFDARINLTPEDIPKRWYNLAADLPGLKPPLNPGTGEVAKPEDFEPIFCKEIILIKSILIIKNIINLKLLSLRSICSVYICKRPE